MDDAEFDALMARHIERKKARAAPFLDPARGIPQGYAVGETAQERVNAVARERYATASAALGSIYAPTAFEVHGPDGHIFKVFADGRIEGFPEGCSVVNRIGVIQRLAVANALHGGAPPTLDADRAEQIAQMQRAIAEGRRRPRSEDWYA